MFGRAATALLPSMGVRVLHIVLCAIALLSPVHAARKPRCTADERLCPLEYGSTRFICVERDSVSNCGGCSANGSGQNCEDIDAAAVGCSRDGNCMACFWSVGGWEPEGLDDELMCEVAERQAFEPPPKRVDAAKAVQAPQFQHKLTGEVSPQSPFYLNAMPKSRKDPVARMAAAAPWAAAKNTRPRAPDAHDKLRTPPKAPAAGADAAKKIAAAKKGGDAPAAAAAKAPAKAAAKPVGPAPKPAAPAAKAAAEMGPILPPAGGKAAQNVLKDPKPRGAAQQKNKRIDPVLMRSLPQWLRDKLNAEDHIFDSEDDLLDWLKAAYDARPKDEGPRRRTNAERFALDLPPLPPPLKNKKKKPGDEERERARERRMLLEELRAEAELQAFREGRDPDEAIAAVRLPPMINEKKEAEANALISEAIKEDTLDTLPDDFYNALRSLISDDYLDEWERELGLVDEDTPPAKAVFQPAKKADSNLFADAVEPKKKAGKDQAFVPQGRKPLDEQLDELRDGLAAAGVPNAPELGQRRHGDAAAGPVAGPAEPKPAGPQKPLAAAGQKAAAVVQKPVQAAAAAAKAVKDAVKGGVAPAVGVRPVPKDAADDSEPVAVHGRKKAAAKPPMLEEAELAAAAPAVKPAAKAAAVKEAEAKEASSGGSPELGAHFVHAMKDALGESGWQHFLAALKAEEVSTPKAAAVEEDEAVRPAAARVRPNPAVKAKAAVDEEAEEDDVPARPRAAVKPAAEKPKPVPAKGVPAAGIEDEENVAGPAVGHVPLPILEQQKKAKARAAADEA